MRLRKQDLWQSGEKTGCLMGHLDPRWGEMDRFLAWLYIWKTCLAFVNFYSVRLSTYRFDHTDAGAGGLARMVVGGHMLSGFPKV